jgi:hypothetical protein
LVPDEAAKTMARLSPADEAAFPAFDTDFVIDTSDRKRIVKAVGFDRVQSVLGEITAAFGTAPPDTPVVGVAASVGVGGVRPIPKRKKPSRGATGGASGGTQSEPSSGE